MTTLAVAAVSARLMAEAAAADGFDVVALDLFGDADTRRAARAWRPVGTAAGLRIDGEALCAALAESTHEDDLLGWVPGPGFEACADALAAGAAVLRLIGTPPDAVRRVRDPRTFFGALDRLHVDHPAVAFEPPVDPAGWLVKDARGAGGWRVEWAPGDGRDEAAHGEPPAPAAADGRRRRPGAHRYFQRASSGVPMSATFIADGRGATLLGFNRLTVRSIGGRPFVFCGVVGPVELEAAAAEPVRRAVQAVAAEFGLLGLGSLDFMLSQGRAQVLEVNPRPPASLGLYRDAVDGGVMRAHVRACLDDGVLPTLRARPAWPAVGGSRVVFAPRPMRLGDAAVERLAGWPHCHDLPAAPIELAADDPVCSLSAEGPSAEAVQARLDDEEGRLLAALEETT